MSHQTKENVLFISGIDTNVGKTVATGMIAKALAKAGKKVITQKMIQTGCEHVSEDIEAHRQIQGIPFTDEDTRGLTCPYIFTYPCSPHMAAAKDGRRIDLDTITQSTRRLRETYEYVLLEGYQKIQRYFGSSQVVPIYIEVEDGERLLRAIARERQQKTPQYEEMCRRFLADAADFSEEKLTEAGITRRFINNDMEGTIQEITEYIRQDMSGTKKQG